MSEHRKHERVHSLLRCWCEGDNVTFYARVENISEGGLFLKTSTPLPSGARARISITTGEDPVETDAVVVWASTEAPSGMGLRFEELGAPGLNDLRSLISDERDTRPRRGV